MSGLLDSISEWLPMVSSLIAVLGAIVSIWSFLRTRKRYYEEFMERRKNDA